MEQFREGLGDAWTATASFLPKFVGFLAILLTGYFVAKAIEKAVDRVLERVGFDKLVERGGVKRALARSKYDASSILAKLGFYLLMLFVLQLAFGIFGANPVSDLIAGLIAYLPNIFVAILILVVASAIAAGVKEIVESSLGGLSYGRALATGASAAIVTIGGGGIQTMSQYWQRAAQRAEQESQRIKQEAQGSGPDVKQRLQERKEQTQGMATPEQ